MFCFERGNTMSGNSGIRGYLLQTIVSLLSTLQEDKAWEYVALEPNNESEKVDVAWYFTDNNIKFTQVKSSQNQINLSSVKEWAKELENSLVATEYELILIGPCSKEVANLGRFGKVLVPTPKPLDIDGLIEQASHKLDHYTARRGFAQLSPLIRELIVNAIITKLEVFSTTGTKVSKETFCNLIDEWIKSVIESKNNIDNASNTMKGMKFEEWVNKLAMFKFSQEDKNITKDLSKKELFDWKNAVQLAQKSIKDGFSQITQGNPLSKNARWQVYSDAKKTEEALDNVIVPSIALETHFALRESARHARKALGLLYESDQEGFSREINLATEKLKETQFLFEKIKDT